MQLEKLTKQELIDKLKEQEHLAAAVEFKDLEIIKITKELDAAKKELQQNILKLKDQVHLASAVETKDVEIQKLKEETEKFTPKLAEEISKLKKSFEEKIINKDLEIQSLKEIVSKMPDIEKLKDLVETLSRENKILVKVSNAHLGAFRNLMKSIQGTLDNAIELEAVITDSLQNKKGGSR
jgi:hypothetical protein